MTKLEKHHLIEGGAVVCVGILAYLLLKNGTPNAPTTEVVQPGAQSATLPTLGISTPTPGGVTVPAFAPPGAINVPGAAGVTVNQGGDSNTGPTIAPISVNNYGSNSLPGFNVPQMPVQNFGIGSPGSQGFDVPQMPFESSGDCCGCDTGQGDMNVFGSPQNLNAYLTGVLNNGNYFAGFTPAAGSAIAGNVYNNGGLLSASLGDS